MWIVQARAASSRYRAVLRLYIQIQSLHNVFESLLIVRWYIFQHHFEWSFWIVLSGLKYADNILYQIKAIDNIFQL